MRERREEEMTRVGKVLHLNLAKMRKDILTVYFLTYCSLLLPIWHLCRVHYGNEVMLLCLTITH